MKNLLNENSISSEILYDFNSVIKKLNLTNSSFSYEPFNLGFNLNPEEIYLIIDYESSGNYLVKILDNRNSAQVIKGFKFGKNITDSKIIAPNPFTSIGDNNSIKYFKLIKSNNKSNNDSTSEPVFTNKTNFHCCNPTIIRHKFNHNENIIKTMDKLIELHFKNNTSKYPIDNLIKNQSNTSEKLINLNEIIPKNSSESINLNEVNPIKNKNEKPIDYQEIIKMEKWKNELYSMLF